MNVLILLVVCVGLIGLGAWAITGTLGPGQRPTPLVIKLLGVLPLLGGMNLLLDSFPWYDIPTAWTRPLTVIVFILWGVGVIAHGTMISRIIGIIIVIIGVLALVDTFNVSIPVIGEALRESLETIEQIFGWADRSFDSGR